MLWLLYLAGARGIYLRRLGSLKIDLVEVPPGEWNLNGSPIIFHVIC